MKVIADFHLHFTKDELYSQKLAEPIQQDIVKYFFPCAVKEEEWLILLNAGKTNTNIFPFLGIHPWFLAGKHLTEIESFEQLIASNKCGLGEVGLDFSKNHLHSKDIQIQYLKKVFLLAKRYKKIINLHCIKADYPFLKILKESEFTLPLICHSASFCKEVFMKLLEYNVYFSFSLKNLKSARIRDVITKLPVESIIFESDYEKGSFKTISDLSKALECASLLLNIPIESLLSKQGQIFMKIKEAGNGF